MSIPQRDKDLRVQSGVTEPPTERPIAGGDKVHIRQAQAEGSVFAQCGASERLIGGGCNGGWDCGESGCSYLRSYPSGYTDDDSLGARWNCYGPSGTLQAYALCQETRVPPAAGSGSGLRAP